MMFRTWINKLFGVTSSSPVRKNRKGLHDRQRSFAPCWRPWKTARCQRICW